MIVLQCKEYLYRLSNIAIATLYIMYKQNSYIIVKGVPSKTLWLVATYNTYVAMYVILNSNFYTTLVPVTLSEA